MRPFADYVHEMIAGPSNPSHVAASGRAVMQQGSQRRSKIEFKQYSPSRRSYRKPSIDRRYCQSFGGDLLGMILLRMHRWLSAIHAVIDHRARSVAPFRAVEDARSRAVEVARLAEIFGCAQKRYSMDIMAAGNGALRHPRGLQDA